jgi:hypothetical protein
VRGRPPVEGRDAAIRHHHVHRAKRDNHEFEIHKKNDDKLK